MTRSARSSADLLSTYVAVQAGFALDVAQVADATGVSVAAARTRLNKLRDLGLVSAEDVNSEAQGSRRQGAFKMLVWQEASGHSIDDCDTDSAATYAREVLGLAPVAVEPVAVDPAAAKPGRASWAPGTVEAAAALRAEGLGWKEIGQRLGVKSTGLLSSKVRALG